MCRPTGVLRRARRPSWPPGLRRAPRTTQQKKWFVYAKSPFAGPEAVLAYLARYTHRVAISNSRLVGLDERGITFRYKGYRSNGRERCARRDWREAWALFPGSVAYIWHAGTKAGIVQDSLAA